MEEQNEVNGKKKKYVKPDIAKVLLEPATTLVDPCKCAANTNRLGTVTYFHIGNDCYNSANYTQCYRYSRS
jgi:hypothetical protein